MIGFYQDPPTPIVWVHARYLRQGEIAKINGAWDEVSLVLDDGEGVWGFCGWDEVVRAWPFGWPFAHWREFSIPKDQLVEVALI